MPVSRLRLNAESRIVLADQKDGGDDLDRSDDQRGPLQAAENLEELLQDRALIDHLVDALPPLHLRDDGSVLLGIFELHPEGVGDVAELEGVGEARSVLEPLLGALVRLSLGLLR